MKRKVRLLLILYSVSIGHAVAQGWTARQCMQYAVEHNHEVKRAELELDNYKAQKTAAIGKFLPYVDAATGVQYNYGRAIDPETNTYTNVSTFHNNYSVGASLPVFDGFGRLNGLKAAKASVLMGHSALREQQDQTALSVLQAFANVAYYGGMVRMAEEKLAETTLLLTQTQVLEEVGRKSAADVAQVESQKAEADYELTRQQNLYASALLELKKDMGFPLSEELRVKSDVLFYNVQCTMFNGQCTMFNGQCSMVNGQCSMVNGQCSMVNGQCTMFNGQCSMVNGQCSMFNGQCSLFPLHSSLEILRRQAEVSQHEWRQARASLFPSLSLSAGLSTTYYHTLHTSSAASFSDQFKNNMGEYIGATLSIPIFNRLQTITTIRRAKNNYRIACEAYEQKRVELEKLNREAWQDWQAYQKQAAQMEKKVEADSLAYQLTRRQYEEGLSTAIDLHTTSTQLLQSRATLLQCQLMVMVKKQLVRYYQGEIIWE